MNWGYKIIIVFILFAAGIGTLVVKSMQARIDMVTPDYYAEELKFQRVMDGQRNAERLSSSIAISQPGQSVTISFPPELHGATVKGTVLFYRPSDSRHDFTLSLSLDSQGQLAVPRERFLKGNYRVKLDWEQNGTAYFKEMQIYVQ